MEKQQLIIDLKKQINKSDMSEDARLMLNILLTNAGLAKTEFGGDFIEAAIEQLKEMYIIPRYDDVTKSVIEMAEDFGCSPMYADQAGDVWFDVPEKYRGYRYELKKFGLITPYPACRAADVERRSYVEWRRAINDWTCRMEEATQRLEKSREEQADA